MDINYELYKVFYHVAKTLSFSESANALFISQSAVSQSVKTLEKKLGQTLFVRSTKRVSLTKEGELLFKHIEPAIHLISRGEKQLLNFSDSGSVQLRIAASDTICRYYLVSCLSQFHQVYPDIHIRILNGTSLACAKLLEAKQADLVVSNSPNPALNNNMKIVELKDFQDVFIANPDYFPLSQKQVSFADLQKLPLLMLGKHSTTSAFLHSQFLQHSLDLAPAIELSSNDLLIDLAKIGLGIAFVPDFCVTHPTEHSLIVLNMKEPLPKRTLVAAFDNALPLAKPLQYFIQLMKDKAMEATPQ